jgi:multiple antibiotic resistance protein
VENVDVDFVLRVTIALLVITSPFDPVKLLFFNRVVDSGTQHRATAAAKLTLYVTVILAISALVGKELLEAMGIDLNAFGAVGGIVIAGMGFEMLYGGGTSQTQGQSQCEEGPEESDGLMIPMAIPLIAGPGAITTAITFSSQNTSWAGLGAMAVAVAAVAVATFIFYNFMGGLLGRMKPAAIAILARLGGLILATLGLQMLLNGLKQFFAG